MDDRARVLVETVMDMLSGTAENMIRDPYHAPALWLIENWWHTLNAALQVGDHLDNKSNSFKATDEAESKKTHEDVKSNKSFEV